MSLYWKCQLGGWGFYAVVGVTVPTLFGEFAWASVALALLTSGLGLAFTHQLRRVIRRRSWTRLPPRHLAPRVLGSSIGIAVAITIIYAPVALLLVGSEMPRAQLPGIAFVTLFNLSATILGWSLIYLGVQYVRGVQEAEAERWRLQLAVRDAELGALRAQLNPHFLFNSLNNLRALIPEDPARAQQAVTELARLLRYALRTSDSDTVRLQEELATVRTYLSLESIRLEERLDVEIDVAPGLDAARVPPMLLQTLAENAIKHGIARRREGGAVMVRAWRDDGFFRFRVANTGTLAPQTSGGYGLRNSRERLRLHFGDQAALELTQQSPDLVVADVRIPIDRAIPAPSDPAARTAAAEAATAADHGAAEPRTLERAGP